MRWVVALILVAGCGGVGRPLADWLYEGATTITLPDSMLAWQGLDDRPFWIAQRFALLPEEQDRPLTFAIDYYRGALAVSVNGEVLEDRGDTDVGEHLFAVPPARTLEIRIDAARDLRSMLLGFAVAPRLAIGSELAHGGIARFNRDTTLANIALCAAFALLFGTLFALDRRRRADGWFAVQCVAALAIMIWDLGYLPGSLLAVAAATLCLGGLATMHAQFDRGPPPRYLLVAYVGVLTLGACGLWSFPVAFAGLAALALVSLAWGVHLVRLLWRAPGPDARVLLLAMFGTLAVIVPIQASLASRTPLLAGLRVENLAIVMFALAQGFVLARAHVARQRELEAMTVELQHQIAARSRDLASALQKLAVVGAEPRDLVDGRYRVIAKLGQGGMGAVHEVERLRDGKRFALKTLRGEIDADLLARFAREAKLAAELSHPNVVPVIDLGVADGGMFVVMPLIRGGSLEDQRARFGDAAWARPLLAQIARGIAAIHARGIVHRDLKPANILLDDGVPRIADFGLAGDAVSAEDDTVAARPLTAANVVMGTPMYMAPELAGGAAHASAASDVFAFGVIAAELLTGMRPFAEPPIRARTLQIDTTGLDHVLARCLAVSAGDRPNAGELVAHLE